MKTVPTLYFSLRIVPDVCRMRPGVLDMNKSVDVQSPGFILIDVILFSLGSPQTPVHLTKLTLNADWSPTLGVLSSEISFSGKLLQGWYTYAVVCSRM